ncbi:MAG: SMP-30/gluconolactonase/LRE family protein [Gammaproteobacteria bacterium]
MKIKLLFIIAMASIISACDKPEQPQQQATQTTTPEAVANKETQTLPSLSLAWETEGFGNPESVVFDEKRNHLYVSNVMGSPVEKDGKGTISIVSMDGDIIEEAWIVGLHSPKGLALHEDTLYVADVDTLVEIDINTRLITNYYQAVDAEFLNDVTAGNNGVIYVTDMMKNRIYSLENGSLDIWLESADLETPNGILAESGRLIIGSWGNMTDGFATEIPGHLKEVDLNSKQISSLGDATPVGNLDGVESDGNGNYYVTDWMAGKLYLISPSGKATLLLELGQGTADIDVILGKNLLFVPMMNNNQLLAYRIN